jgi:hypothetical protein
VDRVHGAWTGQRGSGPPWTEAAWTTGRSSALSTCGVRVLGLAGDGGGGRAGRGGNRGVLTEAQATAKRRRDGGKEQWQLELIARVKEGVKELRRGGKGVVRAKGSRSLLYGPRERRGGVAGEVMVVLMALMPLKMGRVRGGVGRGLDGEAS